MDALFRPNLSVLIFPNFLLIFFLFCQIFLELEKFSIYNVRFYVLVLEMTEKFFENLKSFQNKFEKEKIFFSDLKEIHENLEIEGEISICTKVQSK